MDWGFRFELGDGAWCAGQKAFLDGCSCPLRRGNALRRSGGSELGLELGTEVDVQG